MKYYMQLPSFKMWAGEREGDIESQWRLFKSSIRRIDQAFSLTDLLWPNFIIWEGLLLRSASLPEDIAGYISEFRDKGFSDSQIEYAINHVHLADQFINDPDRDNVGNDAFLFLANSISEMWSCRLKDEFPDICLEIGVNENEGDPEIFALISRR